MDGELRLTGTTGFGDERWHLGTFWPVGLRVNHNPRLYPVGRIVSIAAAEEGFEVTADIVVCAKHLAFLRFCPLLGLGGIKDERGVEITTVSILDYPANAEIDERTRWSVTGRLPRVAAEWTHVREWRNGGEIELFEVGRDAHGDLAEVPHSGHAVSDRTVLEEWLW